MAQFTLAIGNLLGNEGDAVIENDNGRGLNRWGITWATVEGLKLGWTEDYLRSLPRQAASDFYLKYFWVPSNLGLIGDQALANKTLDLCVNMGQGTAIKLLQKSVGATPDGVLGPVTAKYVNSVDPQVALGNLRSAAEQHYRDLVVNNPALEVDLKGWLARLQRA